MQKWLLRMVKVIVVEFGNDFVVDNKRCRRDGKKYCRCGDNSCRRRCWLSNNGVIVAVGEGVGCMLLPPILSESMVKM